MSKDIIGINIGSKNTVIGTYKKGTFEVILSETSSRTIPTVISFNKDIRSFGEIAQNKIRANNKNTIIYPNRWLGVQNNYSIFSEELKYGNIIPKKNNNNILSFNINFKGQKEFYTPESLMGLFFSKIKNIWLNQNINTNNIVVSIPDYSTVQERKAMIESILIGGLNCISLLNESSAISLAYGFQKLKEFNENSPRIVAFIDFGHSQSTIFFAQFTKNLVKVVSVSTDRFCGARDFDYLIAEKLAYEFQKRYGLDPLDSPKAKITLINAINKARKTLTVNKEVSIAIDSLMEGHDLVYNLTREDFNKIISPILQKFEKLCINSIQKAINMKVNINNLHSVEMVGDTLRTPILNEIIKKVFNRDLSKTLVPDECISRGCALFSMMNSPYFAIKNFTFQHYNKYLIQMECPCVNQYGQDSLMYLNIFFEGENIPSSKTITLNKLQLPFRNIIQVKFFYFPNDPELSFLPNKLINSYNIYLPIEKRTDWKLNLIYNLDINCIPQLVKAYISELFIEKNEINPPNNNINQNPNIIKDQIKEIQTDIKFELTQINFGTPINILNEYINREKEQEKKDKIFQEAIGYKNSLEQYIYDTRNKIEENGQLKEYITKKEKNELTKKMDELMNWLYSEDKDLNDINILEEKSKDMKNIGDQIYKRYNEWNALNGKFEKLQSILNDIIMSVSNEEVKIMKGQKSDLNKEDITKIKELMKKTFSEIAEKKKIFDKKDFTNLPSISPDEIEMMINNFSNSVNQIKNEAKEKMIKEEKEKMAKEEKEKMMKEEKEKKSKEQKIKNGNKDKNQ